MQTQHRALLLVAALIGLGACDTNQFAVQSNDSQVITLQVGQELDLTVGTVGPGAYQAPTISSTALRFLGDSIIGPYVPAGPRQLFRFQGVSAGRAIVVLTHSGHEPTITDTVVVQ